MSHFPETMRQLSDRLSLPQQARARVLLEVSGDLEDLYRTFRGRGLSDEEAAQRALDHIDLSDEALRSLASVHGGWLRALTDSVAERAGSRWEAVLLGALVLLGLILSGSIVQAFPMARRAGLPLVPVALVAALTFSLGAWKAYVLWVRRDHRLTRLHKGLDPMIGSAVLQLFVAFCALGLTGWKTLQTLRLAPGEAGARTFEWLLEGLALLTMSLGLALAGGLLWFLIVGKVAAIERAEAATLLNVEVQ